MTMAFRVVEAALISQLGDAAAGNYRVMGYQDQPYGADEVLDDLRLVSVFYQKGTFERKSSSFTGPVDHNAIFPIEILVSKSAKVDLSVIDSPTATDAARAAALLAGKRASAQANESLNEVADLVYQCLMDNENMDVNLDEYTVGDRWVSEFEKDVPVQRGDLVTLTGAMYFTCRLSEEVSGVEGEWQTYVDQYGVTRQRMVVGEPFAGASIDLGLDGRTDSQTEAEVEVDYVGVDSDHVTVGEDFVIPEETD